MYKRQNYTYELKLDGVRCLAFLNPSSGVELRNKRNILISQIYPELSRLNRQFPDFNAKKLFDPIIEQLPPDQSN